MEQWRNIPGIPKAYEVSNRGRVRTWHARGKPWGLVGGEAAIKAIYHDDDGYRLVKISVEGGKKLFKVAHLVLLAFEGARPEGMEASHIYGNKEHDWIEELVWESGEKNRERDLVNPKPNQVKRRKTLEQIEESKEGGRRSARARRERLKREGKCVRCGGVLGEYLELCDGCQEKRRVSDREKSASRALVEGREPGKRGRTKIWVGVKGKNCMVCGGALNLYQWVCDECGKKHTEYARERKGFKEWHPGGRGRVPKSAQGASQ